MPGTRGQRKSGGLVDAIWFNQGEVCWRRLAPAVQGRGHCGGFFLQSGAGQRIGEDAMGDLWIKATESDDHRPKCKLQGREKEEGERGKE